MNWRTGCGSGSETLIFFKFRMVKLKISFYSLFVGPVDNVPVDPTPVVRPALAVGCPTGSTVWRCVVLAATIR